MKRYQFTTGERFKAVFDRAEQTVEYWQEAYNIERGECVILERMVQINQVEIERLKIESSKHAYECDRAKRDRDQAHDREKAHFDTYKHSYIRNAKIEALREVLSYSENLADHLGDVSNEIGNKLKQLETK